MVAGYALEKMKSKDGSIMTIYSCANCLEPIQFETYDEASQQTNCRVNEGSIERVKFSHDELDDIFLSK